MLSCTAKQQAEVPSSNHYAKGFEIVLNENYTTVHTFSPWKEGDTLATYHLVRDDKCHTPSNGIRLVVPLRHLAVTSCTHVGFISELGKSDAITGVCNPQIVYNPELRAQVECGSTTDIGDAMTPNVELIMRSAPDAVMVSTYAQGDVATEKLTGLGMPVIYNNEWTENNPLARAEWLRFVAVFFDCLPQADTLFSLIESNYNAVKQRTDSIEHRRSIMSGNNFRGTWYMPSGNTYMGAIFRDAKADYFFADDKSAFSLPLTVENVVAHFSEADVWVGSSATTMNELARFDNKHTWFKSYRTGEVYNFYRRTTETGGNDFWETGVVHPELVLSDIVKVLYPQLMQDYEFYFTAKLQ